MVYYKNINIADILYQEISGKMYDSYFKFLKLKDLDQDDLLNIVFLHAITYDLLESCFYVDIDYLTEML